LHALCTMRYHLPQIGKVDRSLSSAPDRPFAFHRAPWPSAARALGAPGRLAHTGCITHDVEYLGCNGRCRMTDFERYKDDYPSIRMERTGGILQLTFHSDDGPLIWGHTGGPHSQFAHAFGDIARDPENKVVIMTGTGDMFSG